MIRHPFLAALPPLLLALALPLLLAACQISGFGGGGGSSATGAAAEGRLVIPFGGPTR